jgi:tRNA-specific 2-thiouridylase
VDLEGQVVGQHEGVHRFTVGQRRGLGVAKGEPQYVVSVDALKRRVTIGPRASLTQPSLVVKDIRWPGVPPAEPFAAAVQVRHRARPHAATIYPDGQEAAVVFAAPLEGAAAPGQAAVFYDGDEVRGGGWIA